MRKGSHDYIPCTLSLSLSTYLSITTIILSTRYSKIRNGETAKVPNAQCHTHKYSRSFQVCKYPYRKLGSARLSASVCGLWAVFYVLANVASSKCFHLQSHLHELHNTYKTQVLPFSLSLWWRWKRGLSYDSSCPRLSGGLWCQWWSVPLFFTGVSTNGASFPSLARTKCPRRSTW